MRTNAQEGKRARADRLSVASELYSPASILILALETSHAHRDGVLL